MDHSDVLGSPSEKLQSRWFDVLGIPICATNLRHTISAVSTWAKDPTGRFVCVRDVASLMVCRSSTELTALNHRASLVLPDGTPLVWLGRMIGLPVERTCGPDLLGAMCEASVPLGLKHYLFGGKEGVAVKLKNVLEDRFPGICIVGAECAPFGDTKPEELEAILGRIKKSGADIVWIGMSSPKQDIWMDQNFPKLPQTLIGVGAAFDFWSGTVKRAPKWVQRAGFEWAFRLLQEPRRLWRRYLVLCPQFVCLIALRMAFGRFPVFEMHSTGEGILKNPQKL